MRTEKIIPGILTLAAVTILVTTWGVLGAEEKKPPQYGLPEPEVPQPQFFCGYCHVLTYPGIFQKSFNTWEKSKHNKIFCVQCHYPRKGTEKPGQAPWSGATVDSKHIGKNPPERFSFLPLGGETVRTRPRVLDATCMAADCHGRPEDKFRTKKIAFAEGVRFLHQPHLEEKNQVEGQKINCTSCHQHETETRHFQVAKATCHLCHFKNVAFNEGRGKCELCHQLPEKPFQTSGDQAITHQMLKTAKVPCGSCHFDMIRASGGGEFKVFLENGELKTALVLDAGRIKKESCLACHDQVLEIKEADKKKLMHREHVTNKTARCFDCHEPILHVKADLDQPNVQSGFKGDPNHSMPHDCTACHGDPHKNQRLLAQGPAREDVSKMPDAMYRARTNCLGCHVEKKTREKGDNVLRASGKTCILCHTKDQDKVLDLWRRELAGEIEKAARLEAEALKTLTKPKAEMTKEKLKEARQMMLVGRENLSIVRSGNGVHNAKYAILLLNAAITNFKNAIASLEGKEMTEGIIREE